MARWILTSDLARAEVCLVNHRYSSAEADGTGKARIIIAISGDKLVRSTNGIQRVRAALYIHKHLRQHLTIAIMQTVYKHAG